MIHYWGNIIEGCLWITIAAIIFLRTASEPDPRKKRIAATTAITLVVFGISDFIESGTGAWYRPVWLLLLKGTCVVVLVGCFVAYGRVTRQPVDHDAR
jgi:hypothetical protein